MDQHIDDIACMLDVPRRMLNVVATSKGCVVGDLEFQDADGKIIPCGRDATYYMVRHNYRYHHTLGLLKSLVYFFLTF